MAAVTYSQSDLPVIAGTAAELAALGTWPVGALLIETDTRTIYRATAEAVKSVVSGDMDYEYVAANQTNAPLGATGAIGDTLRRLFCVVTDAVNSQVQLRDGSGGTDRVVLPANIAGGINTYPLSFDDIKSLAAGGWHITTGIGVAVFAIGRFT